MAQKALTLRPHPAFPLAEASCSMQGFAHFESNKLRVQFKLEGSLDGFSIPQRVSVPKRRDQLWQKTCFELFLSESYPSSRYLEFNLSPEGDWALYQFSGYRQGLTRPCVKAPTIESQYDDSTYQLSAQLSTPVDFNASPASPFGLCAVLLRYPEQPSFWAARHLKSAPDFHDPEAFIHPVLGSL